jgi:hypothetical protein
MDRESLSPPRAAGIPGTVRLGSILDLADFTAGGGAVVGWLGLALHRCQGDRAAALRTPPAGVARLLNCRQCHRGRPRQARRVFGSPTGQPAPPGGHRITGPLDPMRFEVLRSRQPAIAECRTLAWPWLSQRMSWKSKVSDRKTPGALKLDYRGQACLAADRSMRHRCAPGAPARRANGP